MSKKISSIRTWIFIVVIMLIAVFYFVPLKKIDSGPITPLDAGFKTAEVTSTPQNVLYTDNGNVSLIISDTEAERVQGLSDRTSLATDTAMLFVFPAPVAQGFWMKDMNFSIDMIWLDADKRITYIVPNASPSSYPEVFTPTEKSLYVIEANAGFATQNNLKVGDVVNFDLISS